jgi:uncharacterized protein (DUF1015 family)
MSAPGARILRGFAALRPSVDKPHLVATRSYLTYSDYELRDKLERNPYSYLHVIHPAGMEGDDWSAPQERFAAIRCALDEFVANGWLARDERKSLYVYRQIDGDHMCTGVVGIADISAAQRGDIKVHELTLRAREELFAGYLESVGINAEPALLAYRDDSASRAALATVVAGQAAADFTTTDRIRHTIWPVEIADEPALLNAIGGWEALYIADGHHRLASSRLVAERHPDQHDCHGFLAYCVPHTELLMRGFHRVVCAEDLPSVDTVLTAVRSLSVGVQALGELEERAVRSARQVDWYCGSSSASASGVLRLSIPGTMPIPAWLDQHLLAPLIGITEPRDDKRLSYLGGDASEAEVAAVGDRENCWLFALEAMTFDELSEVADQGGMLPPKSTWIAPKLRSGLILFDFGAKCDWPKTKN